MQLVIKYQWDFDMIKEAFYLCERISKPSAGPINSVSNSVHRIYPSNSKFCVYNPKD